MNVEITQISEKIKELEKRLDEQPNNQDLAFELVRLENQFDILSIYYK